MCIPSAFMLRICEKILEDFNDDIGKRFNGKIRGRFNGKIGKRFNGKTRKKTVVSVNC